MKRTVVALLFLVQCAFAGAALSEEGETPAPQEMERVALAYAPVPPSKNVMLGVYDPHHAFSDTRGLDIEHVFVFWQALDLDEFRGRLRYAERRDRHVMVTIEPYTKAPNWRDGAEHLFSDILMGKFRHEIRAICAELGGFRGQVLVRWGHEMEDPTGRYPWARKDAKGYKAAFRHFVEECRRYAPQALFVWSPKGEKTLTRYYPGDDYVDLVGVSLWGFQDFDAAFHGRRREFPTTFRTKYRRVAAFEKPVIIAELGVSGNEAYRRVWFASLFDALSGLSRFEKLRAVVYFNDKEPHKWPYGLGSPDWRVPAEWFSKDQPGPMAGGGPGASSSCTATLATTLLPDAANRC